MDFVDQIHAAKSMKFNTPRKFLRTQYAVNPYSLLKFFRAAPIPDFTDISKHQVLVLDVFTRTSTDTDR